MTGSLRSYGCWFGGAIRPATSLWLWRLPTRFPAHVATTRRPSAIKRFRAIRSRPLRTRMTSEWTMFAWPLGLGLPTAAIGLWVWRGRLACSAWRRLVLSLVVAASVAPTAFSPCGPAAVLPAVFLIPLGFVDPLVGLFFGVLPVAVVTGAVFGVWSLAVLVRRWRGGSVSRRRAKRRRVEGT